MQISLPKLEAILRYFCSNTDPRFLGKTKLMKLFYFMDFLHVKKFGVPITFDTYYHLEHGPIPSSILNLVNSVIDDPEDAILSGTIIVESCKEAGMQKISCTRSFSKNDAKYFSRNELNVLETLCKKYYDKPAKYLEDISHTEAPWRETGEAEKISYALAAHDADCEVPEETINLLTEPLIH